jgi:hypothetical protein
MMSSSLDTATDRKSFTRFGMNLSMAAPFGRHQFPCRGAAYAYHEGSASPTSGL